MQIGKDKPKQGNRNRVHDKRYDSTKWRRLRKKCLEAANYSCQCHDCKTSGIVRVASIADHPIQVTHGGDFWNQELTAMSSSCHAKKSGSERLNRG